MIKTTIERREMGCSHHICPSGVSEFVIRCFDNCSQVGYIKGTVRRGFKKTSYYSSSILPNDYITLDFIYVEEEHCGNGYGTILMKRLLKEFGGSSIGLVRCPSCHKTLCDEELEKFYEKFGFRNKRFGYVMVRKGNDKK